MKKCRYSLTIGAIVINQNVQSLPHFEIKYCTSAWHTMQQHGTCQSQRKIS